MSLQQPPIAPGKPLPIEDHLQIIKDTIIASGWLGREMEGIVAIAYARPADPNSLLPDLTLFNTRPDRLSFAPALCHHGAMLFHECNMRSNIQTIPASALFIPSNRDVT